MHIIVKPIIILPYRSAHLLVEYKINYFLKTAHIIILQGNTSIVEPPPPPSPIVVRDITTGAYVCTHRKFSMRIIVSKCILPSGVYCSVIVYWRVTRVTCCAYTRYRNRDDAINDISDCDRVQGKKWSASRYSINAISAETLLNSHCCVSRCI